MSARGTALVVAGGEGEFKRGPDVTDDELDTMQWRTDLEGNPIEGRAHAPPMPEWYRRRLENRAQIKARKEHDEMQAKKEKLACPAEMSLDFSPQELDEIRDLFMEVDTDESGEIDEQELSLALSNMGEEVTRNRLRELMVAVDTDGSGTIDFQEFLGMILGLRNGDNKFKGFQSLLKNFFVTPVTVLAEQCKQRGVTVSYRVKSVRKATSIHPTTYLVEAILDGEWVEYVNGSLRQTKEKRSFEGLGISTRDGRAKAAAFALRKLKEFVPGIKYAEGEIPDEWMAWLEQNLDRGVDPNVCLDILTKKGFHPAKNIVCMQMLLAHTSVDRTSGTTREHKRLVASQGLGGGRPMTAIAEAVNTMGSLQGTRILPPEWMDWVKRNLELGVAGEVLMDILVKHGFETHLNPSMAQMLARPAEDHRPSKESRVAKKQREYDEAHRAVTPREEFVYNGVDLHEFDKANLLGHEGVINDLGIKADFWGSCINGMVENAQRFLSGGQDPNAPNKRHIPALHLACANNRRAIVKLLLDHGANMYLGDFYKRSPLHHAAHAGHTEIVKFLVLNGADVYQKDKYQETPLHAACATGKVEVVRWLLLYVTERVRREVTDAGVQKALKESYEAILKKKLTQYQTQIFLPEWLCEGMKLFYKSAGPFFRRLVPEPYEAICELARSRYMTLPGLDELSEQEYCMLATRAMQDSITHVPNRLGRTPLHVCADPPYSKLHPEHQAVITCLVDEFGVEARLKDIYGHNALESLMRRSKGVEHIFGRNHDKFRNTGIAKDTPVPDAGSPASARRQQLAIADDDPAGGARVVRFQDSASTGAGGGAASTGGSSGAALTAAGSGGAGTGTGAGAGAGAGGELPSYGPGEGAATIRTANEKKAQAAGQQTLANQASHLLRLAAARLFEGKLLCEWGCRTWVTLEDRVEHERAVCVRRVYQCHLLCGLYLRDEQWAEFKEGHVNDDCPRRPLVCDYQCGETLEAQHLADHKEKLCVKRPMPPTPCRLGCGVIFSSSMDRYDVIMEIMEEHEREMCPHRIVTCDFDGCAAQMKQHQRGEHRRSHLQDMGLVLFSTAGTYKYKVPGHIREVKIQCWGGGGGGGQLHNLRGGNGGGGGYVETIVEVFGREELTIVVGDGGRHGEFGATAAPANKVLEREVTPGKIGRAAGGVPGGGEGRGGNRSWAAGGGGGYSAVFRQGPHGRETIVIAGGGGGGGTRNGHPGGRAWTTPNGPPDGATSTSHGGRRDHEVAEHDLEEEEEKARSMQKVPDGVYAYVDYTIDAERIAAAAEAERAAKVVSSKLIDRDSSSSSSDDDDDESRWKPRRNRLRPLALRAGAGGSAGAGAGGSVAKPPDHDESDEETPGGKVLDAKFGVAGGELTEDGDDLLRCGRSGGPRRGGKGGYGGGFPGKAFEGGGGADFGAGGGGGLFGGGGGGYTPGLVGGGGGGSSYAIASHGHSPVFVCSDGRKAAASDRDITPATGAGLWDLVGGDSGDGGRGDATHLEDGRAGCVRLRFPGYYDSVQSDFGKGLIKF